MLPPKSYETLLESRLVEKFKLEFYEKLGYYPIVITKITDQQTQELKMMSLEELKACFTPFLPRLYGKVLKLDAKSRKREIVELRHIFTFIARKLGYSFTFIGAFLNKRDHTTIINNLRMFNNLIETDPEFRNKYNNILKHIKKTTNESPAMEPSDTVSDNS